MSVHSVARYNKRRRLLLVLSFAVGFFFFNSQTVQSQTNLPALRNQIDARLAALWDIILDRQVAHYASYGTWFQGLVTHGSIPADGAMLFPDNWGSSPSDQLTNWQDFLGAHLPNSLEMAISIDTYNGPLGSGFTACVWVFANGDLYRRCRAIGPEARDRLVPWELVDLSAG